MKQTLTRVAIAIAIVGGMWALVTFIPNETSVMNERGDNVITKEVEVTPDWASDEDAVKAAQDVIRKKELQAELEVLTSEVAEREARITEIEKELGTY